MNEEITVGELRELPPESVMIVDVRDSAAFALGHIDNSVNITPEQIETAEFPREKDIVVCCRSGSTQRRNCGKTA